MTRQELESLFVENLPVVERIVGAISRRHRLAPDQIEDFGAWVKLRIVENDYSILAKFRGESSLTTYLTVVLAMQFRDYRVREWGRWRPSAAAKRAGPVGIKLETLVSRDGMSIAAAGQTLRSSGDTTLSDRELAEIAAKFPLRSISRPVALEDAPDALESPDRADDAVESGEADAESFAARRALDAALESLSADDRLIVRLHYLESLSVAEIARGLGLPQKPLYRRLERALGALRARLEQSGFSGDRVRQLAVGPP